MNVIIRLIMVMALVTTGAFSRAPLESYKRYMFVMVHGIGANTQIPHDYSIPGPENEKAPRKSAIFDISADDDRMIIFGDPQNWMGNIGGSLKERGLLGHVVWYDFYEPWKSPIYANDAEHGDALSQSLGRRDYQQNQMGLKHDGHTNQYFERGV